MAHEGEKNSLVCHEVIVKVHPYHGKELEPHP